MEKTQDLNDLFSGHYDTLANFFGGDAVDSVLKKRFNIYWDEQGRIRMSRNNQEKAVGWMEKKSKEINRCVPGTNGYWVEPKCR
jgi:hypothetical protein